MDSFVENFRCGPLESRAAEGSDARTRSAGEEGPWHHRAAGLTRTARLPRRTAVQFQGGQAGRSARGTYTMAFEGITDPDDMAIVYAVEGTGGPGELVGSPIVRSARRGLGNGI